MLYSPSKLIRRESQEQQRTASTAAIVIAIAARRNVTNATPHLDSAERLSLEACLNALLADGSRLSVAAAESCTGGEVSRRITSVAGSSAYFLGGIVAYANAAKESLLRVPRVMLETRGAVSEECALAMAEGACRVFAADIAVSTTGIAGPGGATERKPVGLVYVAVAGPEGLACQEHFFTGDRQAVIAAAADAALQLLLDRVESALS